MRRLTSIIAGWATVLLAASATAQPAPLAHWTQFTADGAREERTVYPAQIGSCPAGSTLRSGPTQGFAALVCVKPVPGDPPAIGRIVVLGDTGCRVKGKAVQPCDDAHWPLNSLAIHAADKHPDLVIHVGDYLYRETCPNDAASCPGFNHGNNWATWSDDFFTPARALLEAAPWVIVRGNHEICSRAGGLGWAQLLSPDHNAPAGCPATVAPYAVSLPGGPRLVIADSANDADDGPLGAQARPLAALMTGSPPALWLLTHKPFPSARAFRAVVPDGVTALVLSGHVHDFGSYQFGGAPGSQMIVGTGGTALSKPKTFKNDIAPAPSLVEKFGYLLLVRDGDRWTATLYGAGDQPISSCTINGSAAACTAS